MSGADSAGAALLRAYHERTKHSPRSVRESTHGLDWDNEPGKFKEYVGLSPAPLPPFRLTGAPGHEAVRASARPEGLAPLDLATLSHLLFHAAGVSRTVRSPYGTHLFRTYASAGALYPIEVYVVAGEVDGLAPGVYHYAPREHGLSPLRTGDFRGNLGLAGASPGAATVVLSGIPWRTAWKYTARGFRHLYWDAGMMLANLLAAAAATEVAAEVLLGFVDGAVDGLLGLDGEDEFALCVVPLGRGSVPPPAALSPLELDVAPVSPRPRRDPAIQEARRAIELRSEEGVQGFRDGALERPAATPGEETGGLPAQQLSTDPLEVVVRRRGSSRRLAREPFPASEHSALLDGALAGLPADWLVEGRAIECFVVASALEGVPPGVHSWLPGFGLVREGSFRGEAGYLCLEQRLGADAAAVSFFLADLERYLDALGGRGYAAAQLEAAIVAGRLYLGAYAQCLGASGITFYDDDVSRFLGTSSEPMLVVVAGPEGHRASIRRCREDLRPQPPPEPG